MNTDAQHFVKTLIYKGGEKYVAVLVRGDREVNEVKLINYLGCTEDDLELAEADKVREFTKAEVGFAGPVGIDLPILCDNEVYEMSNFIVGANETGYHLENVNIKDFTCETVSDFRTIKDGDPCPICGKPISTTSGIEVGHIFKLGTKYTEALDCTCLDENGKSQTIIMGCYGIGVTRSISAIIEQHSDENGIVWPVSVAPYHVCVVPVQASNEEQMALSLKIYEELKKAGIEVLLDDRNERVGVKFKDMDLIGIPVRITVGKKAGENIVEFKLRKEGEVIEISSEDAISKAIEFIKK